MKIVSLSLVGYRRLAFSQIESFTITPTQAIQLILGTNGSGKSSLMGELTPLPPNPTDYTKDGSKTITITHLGSTYILKSWFAPSQKHSFKKDEEELNPGGTVTVQKELVRQQFGITAEIHELLTGLQNFTTMSPAKRREWFTLLSDVNYDYALQVYARLKERSRDTTGALKLAKKRLVAETEKVVSEDEIRKLTAETHQLLSELDVLQSQRAPLEQPLPYYRQRLSSGLEELAALSMRLLKTKCIAPYGHDPRAVAVRDDWGDIQRPAFTSIESIEQYISELKQQVVVKQTLISKAVKEHGELAQTVDVLIKTGAEGVRALIAKRTALQERRLEHLRARRLGLEGCEPDGALSALNSIAPSLTELLTELPSNEDKRYSQSALDQLKQKLDQQQLAQQKTTGVLNHWVTQRSHMEAHRDKPELQCPKCQHTWHLGYEQDRYDRVLATIADTEALLDASKLEIAQTQLEIADIEQYASSYRDYVRSTRATPSLQPLWDHIQDLGLVSKSPRAVPALLEQFRHDLGLELQAKAVSLEIHELEALIESSAQLGDANLADSKAKLDNLTLQIEDLTHELGLQQQSVQDYSHYRKQLVDATALGERIRQLSVDLEQTNADLIEMTRRDTLNHCIRQLQYALARKEETLSAVSLQKGIVLDLEAQIAELTVQEEAAKQLVKQLSPTEGLIAEGLLGFIRSFTGQMNQIVRKIWSYPLVVKDCGISSESGAELDYKFPLVVQTVSNQVPDVSKGSSGMHEIVNLSFKIVAMKYLGLSESPLFLDEFAARFDSAHKASATELIKNLLQQQPFTQLFMVSHDYGQYGALPNVEVCVICPNNITVPSVYNQHVSIV